MYRMDFLDLYRAFLYTIKITIYRKNNEYSLIKIHLITFINTLFRGLFALWGIYLLPNFG